jgi:hypothetical protein
MSSTGDAAVGLAAALRSSGKAAAALRGCIEDLEQMAGALAEALEGVTRPDAEEALANSVVAGELVAGVIGLLEQGDAALREYSAQVLRVAGGSSGARVPQGASGDAQPRLTFPSRAPNPSAVPEGDPEFDPRAHAKKQEALRYQSATAKALAEAGYRVRQLPKVEGEASPDYEIEGQIFDGHTPEAETSVDNIRTTLRRKMKKKQADRFVVNLDRSSHTADDLRQLLNRNPPSRLREVLVFKNGVFVHAFP